MIAAHPDPERHDQRHKAQQTVPRQANVKFPALQ
jgi:hypothetical protein